MLFHDHFYDFRDEETGEELVAAESVHWTEWDLALADAHQFIVDHTNQHGHLVWEYQSDDVEVIVDKKIDRHDAIVERKTSGKKYKKAPGEYFVSRLALMPWSKENGWPTASDWYAEQARLTEEEL